MTQYICSQINGPLFTLSETGQLIETTDLDSPVGHIVLSGNECQVLSAAIPVKQAKQIIRALPFALEEQLANEIESNHIEYLGRANGKAYAMVIEHSKMQSLVSQYNPDTVQYLPLLLPAEVSRIQVCIINGIANIRVDEYTAFTVGAELASRMIQAYKTENLATVVFYDLDGKHELIALELESAGFEVVKQTAEQFASLLNISAQSNKWNLLAGPYVKKKAPVKTKNSKLKPLAYLAASLLAVAFLSNIIQLKQYQQMAELVESSSKNFYEQLFPGEKARILKRQFKDKLAQAGGGTASSSGFVNLLGESSKEISQVGGVEWDAIRFNRNKSELELNLIVDNIAQLDSIKNKLATQGLVVDIASANNTGKRIKGVLKVRKNG